MDGSPIDDVREAARTLLERHWLGHGYSMPNADTYPWQWLWDSCFHAIVWADLGDERAVTEIESLFAFQTPSGFVPHMNYFPDPERAVEVWGRSGASTITQPPMYGHAIAELAARGLTPNDETLASAERGLAYLFTHRRRSHAGLIELVHPWESGCDDSARWDAALDEPWTRSAWRDHKFRLIERVVVDGEGGAIANDGFDVASIGFNALVAFNALELASVVDSERLRAAAHELAEIISTRWDDGRRTWLDDGGVAAESAGVRTLDAHFALLVEPRAEVVDKAVADLIDPRAFGADYGPAGIHRDEPTRDPLTYWRGPSWPQMSYLLWVAVNRLGRDDVAHQLALGLHRGATTSGWAEFWHPDTGAGLGAIPQTWATLAALRGVQEQRRHD